MPTLFTSMLLSQKDKHGTIQKKVNQSVSYYKIQLHFIIWQLDYIYNFIGINIA